MDVGWSDIEANAGVYDFSRFDELLASLEARGMRLHLIVDYLNPLYPSFEAADFMTVTSPAFAAMARALAAHFAGRGVTYEVWNEPNGSTFWKRSTADFAAFCAAAVKALHAGDASAQVCSGGLSGFDYRFVDAFLASGGGLGFDAIGVHPYRRAGGESVAHDLVLMRAVVGDRINPAPPIWDTEWGYSSTWYGDGHAYDARMQQAQMVARELLSAGSMAFPLVVYYDLRDGGTDGQNAEHNFGLLGNDYTEKPALVAVRTLTGAVKGRGFVGFLQTGLSSLHALRFDSEKEQLLAVWWDNPRDDVVLELPAHTAGTDVLGRSLALDSESPSELTWKESYGPLYLTFVRVTPTGVAGGSGGESGAGGAAADGGSASSAAGGRSGVSFAGSAGGGSANLGGGGTQSQGGASGTSTGSGCGCSLVAADHGARCWGSLGLAVGLIRWTRRRGTLGSARAARRCGH
ncbi:MAG: hypothetical protein QM756_26005 [Polyangiaceae bacterium]